MLSRGPATLLDTVPVGLARPRDQVDTRALPEFAALRGRLYRRLRDRAPEAEGARA